MKLDHYTYAFDFAASLIVIDQKGIILHANDQFCELSQYDKQELIGQSYHQWVINDSKDIWQTIESGQVWKGEIAKYAKDGSIFWVEETIVPLQHDTGEPHYISIQHNITDYKEVKMNLKQCSRMYQLIIESTIDLIAVVGPDGRFHFVSPSFNQLGYEPSELTHFFPLIDPEDRKNVEDSIRTTCRSKTSTRKIEMRLLDKDDTPVDMEMTVNPMSEEWSLDERHVVIVMRDITDRKENEQMIEHFAYHDTLTDLPNRRLFMKELRKKVRLAEQSKSQLAVMFLDLDRFKYINDYWGHEVGDLILAEAAKRIQDTVRSEDIVARLGGDEFTILLEDANVNEAKATANLINQRFQDPIQINNKDYTISCSIGIALYPEHAVDANELLNRADTALYYVKEYGGAKYAVFNMELEEKSLERNLFENELIKAIEKEQFSIDYQPKVDFTQGKIIGMEALVRWLHPEIGLIPPNKFIPIAEDTGLIVEIGEWVLRRGCEQTKQWQQRKGFKSLTLSVNLSVRQLADNQFLDKLKSVLRDTGLHPKYLELEITESVFANIDNAAHILEKIRKLGVTISLDDFGTGYSSFSYIKDLPIDTLKIDRSFIRDVHSNKQSQAIVNAILNIADTLGINVIAEGIEKKEQLQVLNEDGCKQGQGYFFSKPLSSTDFERFIVSYALKK